MKALLILGIIFAPSISSPNMSPLYKCKENCTCDKGRSGSFKKCEKCSNGLTADNCEKYGYRKSLWQD